MNSIKNDPQKLPDGWVLCNSKSSPGRKYYFNKKTGESSWSQPQGPQVDNKSDKTQKKNKKEKSGRQEKKKEEMRKAQKRKSEGNTEQSNAKMKRKQEKISPLKSNTPQHKKKQDTEMPISAKLFANNRLAQLRAQLTAEIQEEDNYKTEKIQEKPNNKRKSTSNTTQIDKQAKKPKTELKSPNLNESKCSTVTSTTQSPSSDSLHSIPSPSQFLAANKIISSMKAQLLEEFCEKSKQKDTFADIEQGICSQTPEYPSTKHPATPPQFSEANKLVSAIKSKLAYRVSMTKEKNGDIPIFKSARDRMELLRANLSSDLDSTKDESSFLSDSLEFSHSDEAMEVEEMKEMKHTPPTMQYSKNNTTNSKEDPVLVVDTNIFIHELEIIKTVLNSHIKGYKEQPTLMVPWRVINELDRLKDNNNGNGAVCKRARSAMDYLYKSLPEISRIKGQPLRDANSHIYPCEIPDDEILNCCLQQAERGKSVILLSDDKNLCNKATINSIKCIGIKQLKNLLENKPKPDTDPDHYVSFKHYEHTMYQLLANILESEMRAKYNNIWQHVVFKPPPWTLADVVQCLLKHWIALFNEVFPRIEHLFSDMNHMLSSIGSKGQKHLSRAEITCFTELCLEIARKCQIIPEYMELAKLTVDRLLRTDTNEILAKDKDVQTQSTHAIEKNVDIQLRRTTEKDDNTACTKDGDGFRQVLDSTKRDGEMQVTHVLDEDGEMSVINAFEGVWTVYSSYCAKLATRLNISHNIEDKLPDESTFADLSSKWPVFDSQIKNITRAINGVLNVENDVNSRIEEQLIQLEIAFKDSLATVGMETTVICNQYLRIFCTKCRNMLLEACTKFNQLTDLLDVCKTKIAC